MEVSESLHARAVTSLWIEEDDGHWRSTLCRNGRIYKLYNDGRRISQLLVLWTILLGDPVGLLSNACGRAECVNPFHYRDESDHQQAGWREEVGNLDIATILARKGISEDDVETMSLHILDIADLAPSDILDAYGMTKDMGCYQCGGRFDPVVEEKIKFVSPFTGKKKKLTVRSFTDGGGAICPECYGKWTKEDLEILKESDAD